MTSQAATLDRDRAYACPVCGKRQRATGLEVAMFCNDGGRHRLTPMRAVTDTPSHRKQGYR